MHDLSYPGIAHALETKIYADPRKRALIDDQDEDPEIHTMMTTDTSLVRTPTLLHLSSLRRFPRHSSIQHLTHTQTRFLLG
jgi:hypothetical protein